MISMPKAKKLYRCDVLRSPMNEVKRLRVAALLAAWRRVAVLHGREQWRLFFETGTTNPRFKSRLGYDSVGTSFGQMIRNQVVGALDSFLSNRQNDFRDAVNASSVEPGMRHQLHFINRWKAWHTVATPLTMKDGAVISLEVRQLARAIFRQILSRHRKPKLARVNMVIDQRMVTVAPARGTSQFRLWARLSTLEKGKPIELPLQTYDHFTTRAGERALTVQVNQHKDGSFGIGVLTNVTASCQASRERYQPKREALALDLGLNTLFATDSGDLLGRDWKTRLQYYDKRITSLARHLQKSGIRPNLSTAYRERVAAMRGWLTSNIGRIFNRLVETYAPAELVVERLDFRAPGMSRRLNRLLSKMGKGIVQAKLKDLEERFGIRTVEIFAPFTSQTDAACGYVDKRNRQKQEAFKCLWCGSTRHADVNAARNHLQRRSLLQFSDYRRHRDAILDLLVRRHVERFTRTRGSPADPRLSNPYFKGWSAKVTSILFSADRSQAPSC